MLSSLLLLFLPLTLPLTLSHPLTLTNPEPEPALTLTLHPRTPPPTPNTPEIPFPIPSTTTTLYLTPGRPLPQSAVTKLLHESALDITTRLNRGKPPSTPISDLWHGTHWTPPHPGSETSPLFLILRIMEPDTGHLTLRLAGDIVIGLQRFFGAGEEERGGARVGFRYVSLGERGEVLVQGRGDIRGGVTQGRRMPGRIAG
ncbi:MAG: hypothetical protein LQ339_003170 [Xanthoria mediterranea]|nr:MAG: hypothetical protein LQ339_003170 [Xanthoria mediterranea]